jgi:hypothetical protein
VPKVARSSIKIALASLPGIDLDAAGGNSTMWTSMRQGRGVSHGLALELAGDSLLDLARSA